MTINSINTSVSFGKLPVMKCTIKDAQTKKIMPATLYQLEVGKASDVYDVEHSKNTMDIYNSFIKDSRFGSNYRQYYMLQNDKTQEVIGCAQTSSHFSMKKDISGGHQLLVEELSENKKYLNGKEPILTYLLNVARKSMKDSVVTAFDTNVVPNMKQVRPKQISTGEFVIPASRFDNALIHGEKRYNISYDV